MKWRKAKIICLYLREDKEIEAYEMAKSRNHMPLFQCK